MNGEGDEWRYERERERGSITAVKEMEREWFLVVELMVAGGGSRE